MSRSVQARSGGPTPGAAEEWTTGRRNNLNTERILSAQILIIPLPLHLIRRPFRTPGFHPSNTIYVAPHPSLPTRLTPFYPVSNLFGTFAWFAGESCLCRFTNLPARSAERFSTSFPND